MLNERRVKHMVKLASYESKKGADDMKINTYFKKDYISFNVLCSLIWMTVGYFLIVGLVGFVYIEQILDYLSLKQAIMLAGGILGVYAVLLIIYGVIASEIYKKKHIEARHNIKCHRYGLEILERLYEKEDK